MQQPIFTDQDVDQRSSDAVPDIILNRMANQGRRQIPSSIPNPTQVPAPVFDSISIDATTAVILILHFQMIPDESETKEHSSNPNTNSAS